MKEPNNTPERESPVAFDDEITRFLLIARDPLIRPDLLALLQELELLSSYLEAENGTN